MIIMKKLKILTISLLISILLVPSSFVNKVSGASPPSYVGIKEGQTYIWEVDVRSNTLNAFVNDFSDSVNNLHDFLGADTNGMVDYLINSLPPEYQTMNLSTAITEAFSNITSSNPLLPAGWVDMNFSMLISQIIDNFIPPEILPDGWIENHLTSEIIAAFIEDFTDGLLSEGWTDLNMSALVELILDTFVTPNFLEPGWMDTYNITTMVNHLIENITDSLGSNPEFNGWIDFNTTTLIMKIIENFTSNFMPLGWLDMGLKDAINTFLTSGPIKEEWLDLNISRFIGVYLENVSSGIMPEGWTNMTISELTDIFLENFDGILDPNVIDLLRCLLDLYATLLPIPSLLVFIGNAPSSSFQMGQLFNMLGYTHSMTIQEMLDAIFSIPSYAEINTGPYNIVSITDDFEFVTNALINNAFLNGTINFYDNFMNPKGITNYFTVNELLQNQPSIGDTKVGLDSHGISFNLTQLGISPGDLFKINNKIIQPNPLANITVRELINMSLDNLQQIYSPHGFFIFNSDSSSIVNNVNISLPLMEYYVYNISLMDGVAHIDNGTFSMDFDITSVYNNGTDLILSLEYEDSQVDLIALGFSSYDTINFYTKPWNLTTMSISDMLSDFLDVSLKPFSAQSIQGIIDTLMNFLPYMAMNSSVFTLLGLTPPADIYNLTVKELISYIFTYFNAFLYQAPLIDSVTVLDNDGNYNLTVSSSITNNTWIGKRIELSNTTVGIGVINQVYDNGNNITIVLEPMSHDLSDLGVFNGQTVSIYGATISKIPFNFDLTNLTVLDVLSMIPGYNVTFPDFINQLLLGEIGNFPLPSPLGIEHYLSNMTFRELVQYDVSTYNWAINNSLYNNPLLIAGPYPIYSIDSDYELTISGYFGNNDYSYLKGMELRGAHGNHTIYNVYTDALHHLHVELNNIPSNNLTELGYVAMMDYVGFYMYSEFDLVGWNLVELINYTTNFIYIQMTQYLDYLNGYMEYGDVDKMLTYFAGNSSMLMVKMEIDSIGIETELYPGGISGVPINVTFYTTKDDGANWHEGGIGFLPLHSMNIDYDMLIVDPTSNIPGYWLGGFGIQFASNFGLIMAKNYNWDLFNMEFSSPAIMSTIPGLSMNIQPFSFLLSWTEDGIFENIELQYSGVRALSFSLVKGELPFTPGLISGFGVAFIVGVIMISVISVTYVIKKKQNSK